MNQHRVYRHEENIDIENERRESKNIQWSKRSATGHQYIDEMRATSCEPIHVVCGMMNRMESPEVGIGMEKAVRPILAQISYEKREEQLNKKWQILHPILQTTEIESPESLGNCGGD